MNVDNFDFELPRELIATVPASPRDSARLLHVGPQGLADAIVRDLADFLRPGDLLVSNDTKVIPARLIGRRGEAKIEVTLLEPTPDGDWTAFARPAKKLKPGDKIVFGDDFAAHMVARGEGGEVTLRFDVTGDALMAALDRHGRMPLPPYIKREAGNDDPSADRNDYQTMFATNPGAVAAPTAGLHFTPDLLARLEARGVERVTLTLHVGAGTFLPVTAEDTADHKMHAERGEISEAAVATINRVRRAGGRILAVGSTSTRLLESAAAEDGTVSPYSGRTDIFITPGYRFRCVDLMMTNFHLPRSTLFMLVSAFAGLERMQAAYEHAKKNGYRFYSYGDACLLEPK
jgi:S-adenosylmethionine:tRNA ribosyltransferase-isomerase